MYMLSHNKTAMGIAATATSTAGAELGSPNPTKMHFFLRGLGWLQDRCSHLALAFRSRRKTQRCGLYALEYFALSSCAPVQPLPDGINCV